MTNRQSVGGDGVSAEDFNYIRSVTKSYSGIALDESKHYLVRTRLLPLARSQRLESVEELIGFLRSRPFGPLHVAAIEALVTTETSFFRDLRPFEGLRTEVLPELIRRRAATTRSLTVWCAACASGQEAHSLAMLLDEHFPMLRGWSLQLLASDVSHQMVARAKAGLYQQNEVNRGLPARLLVRYFEQSEGRWRLKEDIRSRFRFFQHNLVEQWTTIPPVDILMLRNVLIYFDVATRQEVLARVRTTLRRDGYLVLGAAETTLNLDQSFRRVELGGAIFYQLGGGRQR